MHCTTGHYRFLSCRDAALFPWHALLLWPQNQLWKHRELCLPHGILFRARYCFHQECRRSGHDSSQVWARFVAGLHFSAELRRKSATGGKYRRRSAIFCRPATLLHATCDVSPLNLRHFGPRPATTHPINGSVPATCDVSPPNLRRSPCHRNISYPNTGKIRCHHGR